MVVLIFNFLVGSAMLEFLQPDSLAYWLPTGWRFDYILLAVVGSLVCISLFIYIPRQIRQIRLEKQSAETMFLKLGRLLLMEFFLFSSLIWGLNHLIVPNRIELDSPVVLFDLDEKPVSVMKIRKTTPNGVEHGISTNISSFLISANDLHSGERLWSRISTWQEYLIGGTTEGLLLLNNKKKTLYFINPETGKKEMNEKEFLEKFPVLADNLSYLYTDYAVANPDELYLYGLDGRYYRINFTTKEITEDPAYADQIRPFSEVWDDEAANKQAEVGKIEELYPELMDVGLIETGQADQQLVVYQKKRNDRRQTLALLDLTKRHVIWEQLLDAPPENADTSLVIDQDEQFAYAWTGRYQYKINKQTGEVVYQYDHKRGRLAAGQTSRRSI
ncbi:PA2928 family protein [Edaphobacillus lindanitolerans]|nr:PA2928 family protein [Edaphobacillus lindanitolerans]